MTTRRFMGVRRVLMDTSAYYALVDPGDANHATASAIINLLAAEPSRLFTTNFILAETHALLLARRGRATALRIIQEIDHSATTVVRVGRADESRAREILSQYDDKNSSLTDATSFAIMERLGIQYAFTFDRNFAQYGLTVLTAT